MEAIQHSETYVIRTCDIDHRKQLTVPALINLMNETAMQHVLRLRLSVWDLAPHHISWVLMRKHLWIQRSPVLGETLTVHTRPTGVERIFTFRDYHVRDAQGEPIAQASTTWVLMHTQTRKLTPIPDFILAKRLAESTEHLPRPSGKLPEAAPGVQWLDFAVHWHDLDFNQHLSNVNYPRYMMESLPEATLQEGRLTEMELIFKAECYWRDLLRAECQGPEEGQFLHRLIRRSDDKVLALARTRWE